MCSSMCWQVYPMSLFDHASLFGAWKHCAEVLGGDVWWSPVPTGDPVGTGWQPNTHTTALCSLHPNGAKVCKHCGQLCAIRYSAETSYNLGRFEFIISVFCD